jgi:DNA mismatch repair protein MutS
MVEMIETASILHHATTKSFVIFDEVGRGTATYDGLSLAWACIEYLATHIQCRTLFATHYHELTDLEKDFQNIACYTLEVKEWEEEIIFLHSVKPGRADRSYGIHVARLAGLPELVLKRAEKLLMAFEEGHHHTNKQSSFSSYEVSDKTFKELDPALVTLKQRIQNLSLENLSPKQALDFLYELKSWKLAERNKN